MSTPVLQPSAFNALPALQKTVQLTAAQILACQQTPITIVPAPTAGKTLVVLMSYYQYKPGTTSYSAQGNSGLFYGAGGVVADTGDGGVLNNANQAGVAFGSGISNGSLQAAATDGKPIVYGASQDPTGGDGTLQITVFYMTVGTSF